MRVKRVAVVGASGHSGEEITRLLIRHPHVELTAVTSRQHAGLSLANVFPRFAQYACARSLRFTDPPIELLASRAELVFLALPHGVSARNAAPLLNAGCTVIDLSADFRLKSETAYKEYYGREHPAPWLLGKSVYGLPEVNREQIRRASLVASPGCYPTSILLPLIPLLQANLIKPIRIIVNSLSGISGAGRRVETDFLFSECCESARPYGVPQHRHLAEIEQELSVSAHGPVTIQFTPHLIPINRGILTTISAAASGSTGSKKEICLVSNGIRNCYLKAYGTEPFIRLIEGDALPDTKNVIHTNIQEIAWRLDARTGHIVVMSAEDNLLKGAGGQAVQCMNIICGFPETAGLM